ncbi:MAG: TIGR01777 family oxidoreductase [Chitinophagaceae bacterium]
MATVLITGGTGLVGKALSGLLTEKGYSVIILTRNPRAMQLSSPANITYSQWDIDAQTIDADALGKADYIVHLAGEGVADKRWNEKRKKEIRQSRTSGSALLVKALKEMPNRVKAVVSASAIGWYSEDPEIPNDRPYVETDPPDFGFMGETCKLWEESIQPVTLLGKRLVKMRTGIVLSKMGGAFAEFIKPVRFGVAGILGNGKQVISWIHIDDLCRMYVDAIENESLFGPYNAVAPKPVNNKALILQIAKTLKGNFCLPLHVPSFALKFILGGMSIEVLRSTTVSCEKIRIAGFNFVFPSIESAVNDLLRKPQTV